MVEPGARPPAERTHAALAVGLGRAGVDADDAKIALGTSLRFLGEIIWFPSAALGPRVSWEPIDATHARGTLRDGGLAASAVFTFDERGRMVRLDANRYLGGGSEGKLTPWFATCSSWRKFEGVVVPDRGEVGWTLANGPFIYFRWQVLDLQFDRNDLYGSRSHAKAAPAR